MNDDMGNKTDTYRVGKTVPSRPSKLTIIGLIGVVIAFFVMVLTTADDEAAQNAVQRNAAERPVAAEPK